MQEEDWRRDDVKGMDDLKYGHDIDQYIVLVGEKSIDQSGEERGRKWRKKEGELREEEGGDRRCYLSLSLSDEEEQTDGRTKFLCKSRKKTSSRTVLIITELNA